MRVDDGVGSTQQAALDRLELELRKLPEVLAVGFEGPAEGAPIADDAVVTVHVFVSEDASRAAVEQQALDLGRLHLDRPIRVLIAPEIEDKAPTVTSRTSMTASQRVQLISVGFTEDGAGVEVTLTRDDARAVGGGSAAALGGTAEAALVSLRELGWSVPFAVTSCVRLSVGSAGAVLVQLLGSGGGGDRFGVAAGATPQLATAKATLHALNRWLDD